MPGPSVDSRLLIEHRQLQIQAINIWTIVNNCWQQLQISTITTIPKFKIATIANYNYCKIQHLNNCNLPLLLDCGLNIGNCKSRPLTIEQLSTLQQLQQLQHSTLQHLKNSTLSLTSSQLDLKLPFSEELEKGKKHCQHSYNPGQLSWTIAASRIE